jgi:hypothetical protein
MKPKIKERIRHTFVPGWRDSQFFASIFEHQNKRRAGEKRPRGTRATNREVRKVFAFIIFGTTAVTLAIVLSVFCLLTHEPLATVITWSKVQYIAGILVLTGVAMFLLVSHLVS